MPCSFSSAAFSLYKKHLRLSSPAALREKIIKYVIKN